jgi:peptide/nickel transport system substrate-binding protein
MGIGGTAAIAGCAGGDGGGTGGGGTGGGETDGGGTDETQDGDAHLRVAISAPPTGLNTIQDNVIEEYLVTNWMYSNLTKYNHNLEIQPDLATDWEAQRGGERWMFYLRDDASFHHNGEQVTAEDVKATLDAVYDDDVGSPGNGALGPIDTVSMVDETTVQIDLKYAYGGIPTKMVKSFARIVPKEIIEDDVSRLDNEEFGSGPFVLEEWVPEKELTLSSYEDYYLEDEDGNQLPHVDKLTARIIGDSVARTTSIQNGSSDLLYAIPPDSFSNLNSMENVESRKTTGGAYYPITLGCDTEPFDDVRVRKAVKHAIDKEEILQAANQGLGSVGQDNPISPTYKYYTDLPETFGPGAQPEKARELLAEAGYEDGIELDFPLTFSPNNSPQMEPTAVLAKENLAAVGIEFELNRVSWSTFISDYFMNSPFTIISWFPRPIEDFLLFQHYHSDGPWNGETNFNDQEFDKELEAAMRAVDEEEKAEHFANCQRIAQQRGGYVVPFYSDVLSANRKAVKNYHPDPLETLVQVEDVELTE